MHLNLKIKSLNGFPALKVKDGLFLGNCLASKDIAFLSNNKVTLIINCSPEEVEPAASQQITIINFFWLNQFSKLVQQISYDRVYQITAKMQQVLQKCQSVLICSKRGQSRSLTMCLIYFMNQFSWSMYKSLQFINSRRSGLQIRAVLLQLLMEYENTLKSKYKIKLEDKWVSNGSIENLVLTNTYLNSQKTNKLIFQQKKYNSKKKVKIITAAEIISEKKEQQDKSLNLQNYQFHFRVLKGGLYSKKYMSQKNLPQSLNKPTIYLNKIEIQRKHNELRSLRIKDRIQRYSKSLSIHKKTQQIQALFSTSSTEQYSIQAKRFNLADKKKQINIYNREKIKIYLAPFRKRLKISPNKQSYFKKQNSVIES